MILLLDDSQVQTDNRVVVDLGGGGVGAGEEANTVICPKGMIDMAAAGMAVAVAETDMVVVETDMVVVETDMVVEVVEVVEGVVVEGEVVIDMEGEATIDTVETIEAMT